MDFILSPHLLAEDHDSYGKLLYSVLKLTSISFMHSTISTDSPYRICFVCLGNICRSPTAEGIFQHIVRQAGVDHYFYIDSAGTAAYHIGNPANSKSRQVALDNGVELLSRARQIDPLDLEELDRKSVV